MSDIRQLTTHEIEQLRASHYPHVPRPEFDLFIATCNRTGLDPLSRQIYLSEKKAKDPRTQEWVTRYSAECTIDGFRVIAERTGKYQGQDGPYWCGADGKWVDVWLQQKPPLAAKIGILKAGFTQPLWSVAKWDSYAQKNREGKVTMMWQKMPDLMLGKCAEALALRRAFPHNLSGLYVQEEMQQARETTPATSTGPDVTPPPARQAEKPPEGHSPPPATPPDIDQYLGEDERDPMPPPGPGHSEEPPLDLDQEMAAQDVEQPSQWESYKVNFGKHTGKTLRQIGLKEAKKYLDWLEASARAQNKPLSANGDQFRIMVTLMDQQEHGR